MVIVHVINSNDMDGRLEEFEVFGDNSEALHMLPGWLHSIINLSETETLVTVMTCNETVLEYNYHCQK